MKTKFMEGTGGTDDCIKCCYESRHCGIKCMPDKKDPVIHGYFVEVKEPHETTLTIPKRPLLYTFLFSLVITFICSDLFPVRWPYLVIGAVGLSVVSLVAVMRIKLPKMLG